jgi:CRP-like cAMP-binding protein
LRTHHTLTAEDEDAIKALPYKPRKLEAQSYTMREGDRPDKCAVLVTGYAFRHKLTGDGERQILSIHIPGEALDFQNLFLGESDHNVQMLTRGDVVEVPSPAIEQLVLDYPNLGRAILINTLVDASIFREWVLNIGRRDARSRIAHLLCEFSYRLALQDLDTSGVYELPMTQEQLADATGLTAVHVNRVLKALEAEGLIQRTRRIISFPNWQQLRDVGDFNPRYLHAREFADRRRSGANNHLDQLLQS